MIVHCLYDKLVSTSELAPHPKNRNLTHQTMFQVNGSHLVSMLDAYCEINGEALPNLELHQDFLATVAEHVQKDAEPKKTLSLIDRSPTHV